MIKSFKDLDIYQRGQRLYPLIIMVSKNFSPQGFHLRDQLCRAANAIPANIAEGFGRSVPEFKMYLTRALGSCNEVIAHLKMAKDANFISKEDFSKLEKEYSVLGKQIFTLRKNWH